MILVKLAHLSKAPAPILVILLGIVILVNDVQPENALEPILVTLSENGSSVPDDPHDGEEFGYVLSGNIVLVIGNRELKLKKGDSFCFKPLETHYIKNPAKREARVIWVTTPPSF